MNLYPVRDVIAALASDASSDAVGTHVATIDELFAPTTHAAALDISTPIIVGSRGTGKSFWASALAQDATRAAIAKAYPRLRLQKLQVAFGYTGLGGIGGLSSDAIDSCISQSSNIEDAKIFWWATILRGIHIARRQKVSAMSEYQRRATAWEERESYLNEVEESLESTPNEPIVIIYDALDTISNTWPRRRLLTESLLEVVWKMRAYRFIKVKLFFRPDQIDDEALRFVELPKLRTGAVRLEWLPTDLYGMLFSRLMLSAESGKKTFAALLKTLNIQPGDRSAILSRDWSPLYSNEEQVKIMMALSGPFMATGEHGYKKGKTYDWPIAHLADAFDEVTPRSFLIMMQSAATFGSPIKNLAITPDGIRHGLRAASKMRVDQLHQDFPWIKGVLAPLAGLLLPLEEAAVYKAWKVAGTIPSLKEDALKYNYLPPFDTFSPKENNLFDAMEKIGVMFRRKDLRLDMPDLFRVAAKLLKKGATAPLR